MIIIEDLSLRKGRTQVLRNINFAITQGDIVLLAGRNGAGKTTLLRCLLGLEKKLYRTDNISYR
jgi:branched-chain amino acid transport system ATP-binding protein